MTAEEWAAYVHVALDPVCDTTASITSGLVRVDSVLAAAMSAHYEIDDALLTQSTADDCINSIKTDLGLS